ncbi:MAG: type III polyketide synthase [Leucobacter sp.]
MTAQLVSIGTAVPGFPIAQAALRDFFTGQPGVGRLTQRLIGAAFDQSAIDFRYAVIGGPGGEPLFFGTDDALRTPTTGERNALFRRAAPALLEAASRRALEESGYSAADITHVITVSCTGGFAPGPEFLLARALGVMDSAERLHLGFMGCAAALPALRTAARFVAAQPDAVVLVACTELCSLHVRASSDPEQIVAASVFGDGAAAAIVADGRSGSEALQGTTLEIGEFATAVTATGESDMDWSIGDTGFEMRLSAEVPRIVGREIAAVVARMLSGGSPQDVEAWAVHPGGRSVLDRVQSGLGLSDAVMLGSRSTLREYGNMSSATVLFILQGILRDPTLFDGDRVAALAFGPGLTVETARFTVRRPTTGARS